MSYARTVRVNPDNAGRDTSNVSRHMTIYAVFQCDNDVPCAYFLEEEYATECMQLIKGFALPFKVTRKQWDQFFATGRLAWANATESRS